MKWLKLTVLPAFLFAGLVLVSCEKEEDTDEIWSATGLPMTGGQETPAVVTTATGTVDASYNRKTRFLSYTIKWQGLSGPVTAGHIHGTAETGYMAGVLQGFAGIPSATLWGASGTYSSTLFVDGVKILESDILGGRYYANLHTALRPAGEIRGQIILQKQ